MTKSYKEIKKEKEGTEVQIQDACWSGYKQVGMKKKGNRQVPNCVPESVVNALFGKDYIYEVSESVADMYKGTVTPAQLTKMKQLWKTKRKIKDSRRDSKWQSVSFARKRGNSCAWRWYWRFVVPCGARNTH